MTVLHDRVLQLICCVDCWSCYIALMNDYIAGTSEGADAPTWAEHGEGPVAIDRRLRERAKRMARDDYDLGLLLRRGFVLKVHALGGFGSFCEYAELLFGFSARQTEERL